VVLEAPGRRAWREERLTAAGPVLGVIATPGDEPHDWLAAGRALSAVLLGATARHLSTSFFDAPVERRPLCATAWRRSPPSRAAPSCCCASATAKEAASRRGGRWKTCWHDA
jgi:hypothetical protein